jgi:hypothetical protein
LLESHLSLDRKTKDFSQFRRLYYCSNLANLDLSAMSIDSYPETPLQTVANVEAGFQRQACTDFSVLPRGALDLPRVPLQVPW